MTTARLALPLALLLGLAAAPAHAQVDDPWFAPDKALHFGVSAGLAGAAYGLTALATDDVGVRLGVSAGVALAAGIGKELLDLAGFGHPSWKDLTWDLLGTVTGVGLSFLVDRLVTALTARPRPPPEPIAAWSRGLGWGLVPSR